MSPHMITRRPKPSQRARRGSKSRREGQRLNEGFPHALRSGTDVETKYPEAGKQQYCDVYGNLQGHGSAMADECVAVHERIINAKQLLKEEEIRWEEQADRYRRGEGYTSAPSEFNSFPHWPANLSDAASVPDSELTGFARRDLRAIRLRAEDQSNSAYEMCEEIAADMPTLELDRLNQPLISVGVQQLVYQVVSARECAYRIREYHGPQARDQLFHLTTSYYNLRAQFEHKLQVVLIVEDEMDHSAAA